MWETQRLRMSWFHSPRAYRLRRLSFLSRMGLKTTLLVTNARVVRGPLSATTNPSTNLGHLGRRKDDCFGQFMEQRCAGDHTSCDDTIVGMPTRIWSKQAQVACNAGSKHLVRSAHDDNFLSLLGALVGVVSNRKLVRGMAGRQARKVAGEGTFRGQIIETHFLMKDNIRQATCIFAKWGFEPLAWTDIGLVGMARRGRPRDATLGHRGAIHVPIF